MRLIVTRPEPDDDRTARALIRLGHEAILSPMLDIVIDAKAKIPTRPYQAVLATSSNAVRALAGRRGPAGLRRGAAARGRRPDGARGEARGLFGGAIGGRRARRSRRARPRRAVAGRRAASLRGGRGAGRRSRRPAAGERASMSKRRSSIGRSRARGLAKVAEAALKDGTADGVLLYSRTERGGVRAGASRRRPCAARANASPASAFRRPAPSRSPKSRRASIRIAERPDQLALFALIEAEERARDLARRPE